MGASDSSEQDKLRICSSVSSMRMSPVTFNSFNEPKRVKFSSDTRDYRIVNPGLSFLSICKNILCRANGDYVYINKGFNSFVFNYEVENLYCPACCYKVPPATNCGFYMTRWDIEAKIGNDYIHKNGLANDGDYHTFEEGKMEEYVYVKATTCPL